MNKKNIGFVCSSDIHFATFLPIINDSDFSKNFDITIFSLEKFYDSKVSNSSHLSKNNVKWIILDNPIGGCIYNTPFINRIFNLILLIPKSIKKQIDVKSFDLLVFGNDIGHIEKLLIKLFRTIKLLLIQEGIVSYYSRNTISHKINQLITKHLLNKISYQYLGSSKTGLGGCNYLAAYSNHFKNIYVKIGVPSSIIKITGNTRIENISTTPNNNSRTDKNNNIFTYFTSGLYEQMKDEKSYKTEYKEILNIYQTIHSIYDSNFILKVKIHPRSKKENYINLFCKLNQIRIEDDANIFILASESKINFISYSAVAYELIPLGYHCIITSIHFKKIKKYYRCILEYPTKIFTEENDLYEMIIALKNNSNVYSVFYRTQLNNFIDAVSFDANQKASERIINLIYEILKQEKCYQYRYLQQKCLKI